MGVPKCVSYFALCSEMLQALIESTTFKFWLNVYFRAEPDSLLTYLKRDPYIPAWSVGLLSKCKHIGIAIDDLFISDESYNFRCIKQRLLDLKNHKLCPAQPYICSPVTLGLASLPGRMPHYLFIFYTYAGL